MRSIPIVILLIAIPLISSSSLIREMTSWEVVMTTEAEEGEFPYIVSIQFKGQGHQCVGTIINKKWILTVAHCVKHPGVPDISEITISVGTNYLNKGGTTYNVAQIVVHEQYTDELFKVQNDIALLKIDSEIEFTDEVTAVELATEEVPSGADVLSVGWGQTTDAIVPTNELQYLEMETMDIDICRSILRDYHVFDSNICAEASEGLGICSGDSGGSLVYNNELVGTLSWGIKCGGTEPEVYSRVTAFRSWIDENIAE